MPRCFENNFGTLLALGTFSQSLSHAAPGDHDDDEIFQYMRLAAFRIFSFRQISRAASLRIEIRAHISRRVVLNVLLSASFSLRRMTSKVSHSKVVLIGNSQVGKTSLFERFKGQPPDSTLCGTVGGSCAVVPVDLDGGSVSLTIWDTAGQEKYRAIVPLYFAHAQAIVIVYDITNQQSFQDVLEWERIAREYAPPEAKLILVGNKLDRRAERDVSRDAAEERRIELGAETLFETSAITGDGVDDLLDMLAGSINASRATRQTRQNEGAVIQVLPQAGTTKPCTC
jgi:small GTP-binding protein